MTPAEAAIRATIEAGIGARFGVRKGPVPATGVPAGAGIAGTGAGAATDDRDPFGSGLRTHSASRELDGVDDSGWSEATNCPG